MSADIDDVIIDRIQALYKGDPAKARVLLVLLADANEDGQRILRMLRGSLHNNELFEDVCEQAYIAHGGATERAIAGALPNQHGSRKSLKRIDDVINKFDIILRNDGLRAGLYGLDATAGSKFVFIPLVLGVQVGIAVYKWKRGEITGKEAGERVGNYQPLFKKNEVPVVAAIDAVGAVGGLAAGVAIGAMVGPVGAVIGGAVGVTVGSITASKLARLLMRNVFNGTGDEALNRAYRYFDINHTATNEEVNYAFRQKTLKTDPKIPGGSIESQLECDAYMAMIRVARGDRFGQA